MNPSVAAVVAAASTAVAALVGVITAAPAYAIGSITALTSLALLRVAARVSIVLAGLSPRLSPEPDASDCLAAKAIRADNWLASLVAAFCSSTAVGAVIAALTGIDKKRILHVTRRMIRRKVQ